MCSIYLVHFVILLKFLLSIHLFFLAHLNFNARLDRLELYNIVSLLI